MVEVAANVFAHVHMGQLNAVGGASPVTYVSVSKWESYTNTGSSDTNSSYPNSSFNGRPFDAGASYAVGAVCATVDSTFAWFQIGTAVTPYRLDMLGFSPSLAQVKPGFYHSGVTRSPNTFDGIVPFFAIPAFAERAAGGVFSMLGEVPDVRMCNMTNNNPKDEITIGSDVWKLFPLVTNLSQTNVSGANASSYPYGLAFKKSA
jgi:hypothetical protein